MSPFPTRVIEEGPSGGALPTQGKEIFSHMILWQKNHDCVINRICFKVTTINRTNNGLGVINNGAAGIRTITPDIQNDHNIPGGGGVNNMSYSFHGSGSVVLGGGLAAGPGSGVGGSGLVGPPPEGYVSANVFSVRIKLNFISYCMH